MAYRKPDPTPLLPFSPDSNWGKAYKLFLEQVYSKSGSQSLLDHYKAILSTFLSSRPVLPDEMTLEDVQNYLTSPGQANGRAGRPPGAGLQRNRLSVLRSWYKYVSNYGVRSTEDGKNTRCCARLLLLLASVLFKGRGLPIKPYRHLNSRRFSLQFREILFRASEIMHFFWRTSC